MTQQEIGDLLGVTKATVQKYENGKINMKTETVTAIARIFDVHAVELLGWNQLFDAGGLSAKVWTIEETQAQFFKVLRSTVTTVNNDGLEKILDYAECIADMEEFSIRE